MLLCMRMQKPQPVLNVALHIFNVVASPTPTLLCINVSVVQNVGAGVVLVIKSEGVARDCSSMLSNALIAILLLTFLTVLIMCGG